MISFGILVHDERISFKKLLDSIIDAKKGYDYEIVVIYDRPEGNEKTGTDKIIENYKDHIKVFHHPLNNDYGAQKNFMTEKCSGDYIVNPDADELFSDYVLENADMLAAQSEVIWLPRINTVKDMTTEWAQRFGYRVNEKGWINWPDPQARIYKNDYPRIKWINKVHETLFGHESFAVLPEDERLAILHPKTLDRQIKQNEKYAKIRR